MVNQHVELSLVSRLKAGEPSAFDEVYRAYHPRLRSFLWRLCQRKEIADELVQEVWLRLAAEAPWLRDDTQLQAWLFAVARNQFFSHRRWQQLDLSRLALVALGSRGEAQRATPEAEAIANQAQRALESALAKLPVKYREAVLLVSVEKFEPTEAAAIVGVSPEAFRQRLSRGREQLRLALHLP